MRPFLSDEALLGYSLFIAMAGAALLIFVGLGSFAQSESAPGPPVHEERPVPALGKQRGPAEGSPPSATTITLAANGAMLVNTNPFPRAEVELVLMGMLQRKSVPPLVIRCERDLRQSDLMDILSKARAVGVQDIRVLVVAGGGFVREGEQQ